MALVSCFSAEYRSLISSSRRSLIVASSLMSVLSGSCVFTRVEDHGAAARGHEESGLCRRIEMRGLENTLTAEMRRGFGSDWVPMIVQRWGLALGIGTEVWGFVEFKSAV